MGRRDKRATQQNAEAASCFRIGSAGLISTSSLRCGPFSEQTDLSLSLGLCKQHAAGGRVANGTGNDDKGTPHTERNVSFLRPMLVAQTMTSPKERAGQGSR